MAKQKFTKEQRRAAIEKHRAAARNIRRGRGNYHEESDELIEAQYEGLPWWKLL